MPDFDGEMWKTIENFPDYQISNYGRIKSLKFNREKILTNIDDGNGYLQINLYKNKKSKTIKIHILVFETFNGKLKKDNCVHHKDENKLNNYFKNLIEINKQKHNVFHSKGKKNSMYGIKLTGKNNGMYGKKHSEETKKLMRIKKIGENSSRSILKEKQVIKIIQYLDEGKLKQTEIAEKYNVDPRVINHIKMGRSWSYLRKEIE